MAIVASDIRVGEILKVLTANEEDDTEEENWAKVVENNGQYLYVTYLSTIGKIYKGASIHSLEPRVNRVDFECITEHYDGVFDLEEIGVDRIGTNMYIFGNTVNSDDDDSEIYDDEDEDDGSEGEEYDTADGFVVPDTETGADGVFQPPPDAEQTDKDWNAWNPRTSGERLFKETVDRIEHRARIQMDNLRF